MSFYVKEFKRSRFDNLVDKLSQQMGFQSLGSVFYETVSGAGTVHEKQNYYQLVTFYDPHRNIMFQLMFEHRSGTDNGQQIWDLHISYGFRAIVHWEVKGVMSGSYTFVDDGINVHTDSSGHKLNGEYFLKCEEGSYRAPVTQDNNLQVVSLQSYLTSHFQGFTVLGTEKTDLTYENDVEPLLIPFFKKMLGQTNLGRFSDKGKFMGIVDMLPSICTHVFLRVLGSVNSFLEKFDQKLFLELCDESCHHEYEDLLRRLRSSEEFAKEQLLSWE